MNCRSALHCLLPLVAIIFVFAGSLRAQGYGTIVGTISDPSGAVVASARVQVTDEATSVSRETLSNDQGYFVLPSLRPSTYSLTTIRAISYFPRFGPPRTH
jgi:hypothetical protein